MSRFGHISSFGSTESFLGRRNSNPFGFVLVFLGQRIRRGALEVQGLGFRVQGLGLGLGFKV